MARHIIEINPRGAPNMSDIRAKVIQIVVDKLNVTKEQCKDEAKFIEDLGADSLDTVELVMKLEEDFGLTIPDEDQAKLTSVGEAVKYIESKK
jgi:acyl carrier protein